MNNKIIKLIIFIIIISPMIACTGKGGALDIRKPYSLNLEPPPGSPEYRQGWTDGCESGMNVYSYDFYKTVRAFNYKQDPALRNNKVYYQVWKDAFVYCAIFWETNNSGTL